MQPIVTAPNTVLTSPAQPVTSFDKKLKRILDDLRSTLKATKNPKGVGLAAPQIGVALKIFVTRPHEKDPIRVFINPEIKTSSGATEGVPDRDNKLEGCLSIPRIWGKVSRAKSLTIAYDDETGTHHEETCTGFLATIIQHETDHTNGILFTQRVLEQKGKFYQSTYDEDGKETLEEIELK